MSHNRTKQMPEANLSITQRIAFWLLGVEEEELRVAFRMAEDPELSEGARANQLRFIQYELGIDPTLKPSPYQLRDNTGAGAHNDR